MSALAAVHLRHLPQLVFDALLDKARLDADALEQGRDQPVLLLEQGSEKVLGENLLVIALAGDRLGLLERLLRLDGKLVEFHERQRNAATRCGKVRANAWLDERPLRFAHRPLGEPEVVLGLEVHPELRGCWAQTAAFAVLAPQEELHLD